MLYPKHCYNLNNIIFVQASDCCRILYTFHSLRNKEEHGLVSHSIYSESHVFLVYWNGSELELTDSVEKVSC